MQWQSQRTGFSLVWVLRFSALNRMFHKGPLGWPLPALSSCKVRAWCGWERRKGVLCPLLSSVQEPWGPAHSLLLGEQPCWLAAFRTSLVQNCGEKLLLYLGWLCIELSLFTLNEMLATTKDGEIQANLKEMFYVFSTAWICSYRKMR